MATVPMSHPATAQKNSDGTWSVRIQHTIEGSITTVEFTNTLFAEVLAKAYADVLNGKAAVEAKLGQIATDLGPAVTDAKTDVAKVLADAQAEAQKLIAHAQTLLAAAQTEAGKIKADATTLVQSAEAEAVTLKEEAGKALTAAKTEAEKLLTEARTEASKILHTAAAKVEPTPAAPATPVATEAPKPPVVEEE
jgi:vacuolar-type H+-ATPase subunit H